MLDHGHPDAWEYPIGRVYVESGFIVDRLNAQAASQAVLFQMAISSIPNMSVAPESTKSMVKLFDKTIQSLMG